MSAVIRFISHVPSITTIRSLMRDGKDTMDIAREFHVPEWVIWNMLAKS